MKIEESEIVVERSNSFRESSFGIKIDEDLSHIFSVLRNNIYSDKIMAVCREYGTNAMDAHVDSGQPDRPIVVHMPNQLEPYFSIRNFGHGLNEDEVRNIYAMYGASTKRNSNKLNGQFGLGSKAAFSYTDSFQITSYVGGQKYIYDAFIDETKKGSIALLTTTPDDSESGVEITVPVAYADFNGFVARAARLYSFFDVRPIIVGVSNFPWIEPASRQKGYQVFDYGLYSSYGGADTYARMGNVVYPIMLSQTSSLGHYNKLVKYGYSIVIDFDIGDLSIAASRESLEYTHKTESKIKTRIQEVRDQIPIDFDTELINAKDIVQFYRNIYIVNKTFNIETWKFPSSDRFTKSIVSKDLDKDIEEVLPALPADSSFFNENFKITFYRQGYVGGSDAAGVAFELDNLEKLKTIFYQINTSIKISPKSFVGVYHSDMMKSKPMINSKFIRGYLDGILSNKFTTRYTDAWMIVIQCPTMEPVKDFMVAAIIDDKHLLRLEDKFPSFWDKPPRKISGSVATQTSKLKLLDENFKSIKANLDDTCLVYRLASTDSMRRRIGMTKSQAKSTIESIRDLEKLLDKKYTIYFTQQPEDKLKGFISPNKILGEAIKKSEKISIASILESKITNMETRVFKLLEKHHPTYFNSVEKEFISLALRIDTMSNHLRSSFAWDAKQKDDSAHMAIANRCMEKFKIFDLLDCMGFYIQESRLCAYLDMCVDAQNKKDKV